MEILGYYATMETEKFEWSSFGKTEEDAKQLILKLWVERTKKFNDMKTVEELQGYYGIYVRSMYFGYVEQS